MYYLRRLSTICGCLVLFAAEWLSLRFAAADGAFRRGSPESVASAIELAPGNTEYLLFRALQLEYNLENSGTDSTVLAERDLLERAARLNPLNSAPRIRLGLAAEIRGDFASAETWLLEAARIDRQFEPRWTLANFYFRRESSEQFWKWIRVALEVSYGDRRPDFDLCWRVSSNAQEILSRAIPDRHDVVFGYLAYLLDAHRVTAIGPAALKLATMGEADDRAILLAACDALIDARDAAAALHLWRAMGFSTPAGIVHSNFEPPRLGHGFDWRPIDLPGVVHIDLDPIDRGAGPMHRITLNGRQPEACDLLIQVLTLEPQTRYTLRWDARTTGLASRSGIEWRIAGQRGPVTSAAAGPSGEGQRGELSFTAPSDLVPLKLVYERPSGEARAEGSIELWRVDVNPRR